MKRPKPIPGLELRQRHHRDGTTYWTWRVRWRDPRTGKRLVEEFADSGEALDFKATLRVASRRGDLAALDSGRELLADFFTATYWPAAGRTLEVATLRNYASVYNNHVLPRLGHLELRQITAAVVHRWAGELSGDGAGGQTVRKALTVLQAILAEAVRLGEIPASPATGLRIRTPRSGRPVHCPAPAEVERIRELLIGGFAYHDRRGVQRTVAPDPAGATLVSLLAYDGLRPEEALALTEGAVGRRSLSIHQRLVDGEILPLSKTGTTRTPELFAPVRADVAAWLLARPPAPADELGLLFRRPDGQPWKDTDYRNWRTRVFKAAIGEAASGIARPYDLRHAGASLMLRDGRWSLPEVAAHMGHSVQVLSDRYSHVIAELHGEPRRPLEDEIMLARAHREDARATG